MAEQPDTLERLNTVLNEVEQHTVRLMRIGKLKSATPDLLMQELSETVMPLLRDVGKLVFQEIVEMREYIHEEVEPAIMRMAEDESVLMPDDAEMITTRLLSYRSMLEGAIDRLGGDDKAKMDAELAEVDKALARVAEITAEDDDDDEPETGAEETEEDPEEDEPEETAGTS